MSSINVASSYTYSVISSSVLKIESGENVTG